jgi:hypothetical protein
LLYPEKAGFRAGVRDALAVRGPLTAAVFRAVRALRVPSPSFRNEERVSCAAGSRGEGSGEGKCFVERARTEIRGPLRGKDRGDPVRRKRSVRDFRSPSPG